MTHEDEAPTALRDRRLGDLIESLGAKTPAPGGGAVAPIIAAIGTALGRMVVNYSVGRKKLAEHDELHREALACFEQLADRALRLADDDAAAYAALNALMKLDRDDPRRRAEWTDALETAMSPPRESLSVCLDILHLLQRLTGATNRMLASDLVIAAILAEAGAKAAAWNVRINLPLIEDETRAREIDAETERMIGRAATLREAIESGCRSDGGAEG